MGTRQDIDADEGRRRLTIDDVDPLIVLGIGVAALLATLALVFADPDRSALDNATAGAPSTAIAGPAGDPDGADTTTSSSLATETTLRSAPPALAFVDTDGQAPSSSVATGLGEPPPLAPELLDDAQRQMLRLYRSAFGRGPDGPGFTFWSEQIRSGTPLLSVATTFAEADEFDRQFADTDPTPVDLITTIHRNGTGVPPDASTLAALLVVLETGGVAEVIVDVSESPAAAAATGTAIDDG